MCGVAMHVYTWRYIVEFGYIAMYVYMCTICMVCCVACNKKSFHRIVIYKINVCENFDAIKVLHFS